MEEETQEQTNSRPWLFKPGQSGNPGGRPKGSKSLKTYAQEMLRDMTDEEKLEYMKGLDKKIIWEMGEGKPKQDVEADVTLTSKVVKLDVQ
jgi:hypothetical protein